MMNETTLDRLLELIKKDCPGDKSWSVAVRTYAVAQRLIDTDDEEERHQFAYSKVQEYYGQKRSLTQ